LGQCYLKGWGVDREPKRGIELLKQAAELGDTPAMITLGDAFHRGVGTASGKPDDKESFHWYSEAANRRNPKALGYLGVLYMTGAGVTKNPKLAVEKLKEGMDQGDAGSKYFYALSLKDGLGIPSKNPKQARPLFEQAAAKFKEGALRNDIESMYLLASSLDQMDEIDGSKAHYDEMKGWYVKAAEAGHPNSIAWCKDNQVPFKMAPLR
jgi:uncharacterized protein